MDSAKLRRVGSPHGIPNGGHVEFLRELTRARSLLDQGDGAGCLKMLRDLEEEYREGALVLDLLGDVLVQSGDLQTGIRYKTLFSILRKILEANDKGESSDVATPSQGDQGWPIYAKGPFAFADMQRSGWKDSSVTRIHEGDPSASDFVPATPAMGKQLMIQGHFDLALRIFGRILIEHPEDQDVRSLMEEAERLKKQKRMLDVMQGWLENIEKMKVGLRNPA